MLTRCNASQKLGADSRYDGAYLFMQFSKRCPLNYFSFRNQKIPRRFLVRFLPELKDLLYKFHPVALETWKMEMEMHNRMVSRGIGMGLFPRSYAKSLQCGTVDEFMRRHCNSDLTSALESLCCFARRIMIRISRNPGAPFWSVSGAMVITRQSWLEFCSDIASLASLVGLEDSTETLLIERRPGYEALRAAAAQTVNQFLTAACI